MLFIIGISAVILAITATIAESYEYFTRKTISKAICRAYRSALRIYTTIMLLGIISILAYCAMNGTPHLLGW